MNGFIYFIAAETVGSVKIGFSRHHPSGRLKQLQTGCPVPLKVMAFIEGTPDDELRLHKEFADLKIHSEWFRLEGRLLEVVCDLPPPGEKRPDNRPRCLRCGTKADHGRSHLISHRGVTKICPGTQVREVSV